MSAEASANNTGIADRLTRAGLVERVAGEDRRVEVLTLTRRGRQLRSELRDHLAASPSRSTGSPLPSETS